MGNIAVRQTGDEAAAKKFLADYKGKFTEAWPYPLVRYLRGEIDEERLLGLATDNDKRTEARCFLGLDWAIRGNKKEALAHFRWVKEHGNPELIEYPTALAELERLER